jgi:hypothetical protein
MPSDKAPYKSADVNGKFVIIHAEFGEPRLARILEPPEVGGRRDAIVVIAVHCDCSSAGIGHRNDRATLIGDQPAAVGGAAALIPDQRGIDAGAVDIAALGQGGGLSLMLEQPTSNLLLLFCKFYVNSCCPNSNCNIENKQIDIEFHIINSLVINGQVGR